MIYLVGKIIAYLLGALGIGFAMGWTLQIQMARRLREQLNSVIFETKSRIPQLESEITNRDQKIEQLERKVATVQKQAQAQSGNHTAPNAEQERQLTQLRQRVLDLEQELRVERHEQSTEESLLMIDKSDLLETDGDEDLAADDEFLADIQDIFDDESNGDLEVFGGTQSPKKKSNRSDLAAAESARIDDLQAQVEELASNRKELNEVLEAQKKEVHSLQQQRDLQDKSLSVLNQQLELARLANERILRELTQLKSADKPHSAAR